MALENRHWGYKRILGELKKLNIEVARSSIQNILRESGLDPQPDRQHSTWNNFIKTHFHTLIACDFFTKDIWTWRGKITIYIFFFIELGTRRVHLAGMTRYPKQKWVESRARDVLDIMEESGFQPKYLIRDHVVRLKRSALSEVCCTTISAKPLEYGTLLNLRVALKRAPLVSAARG